MAEKNKKVTLNYKWLMAIIVSEILVLASYFIYKFLPESTLANGIEYSGMTAVYVLMCAPILCALSLVLYFVSAKKLKPYFFSLYKKAAVAIVLLIPIITTVVSMVFELLFVVESFKLGFTAPFSGSVYESYGIFILVSSAIQLLAWILICLKHKGNTK